MMGLIAKESGGNFIPVPPGTHLARCYRVIDLGTQKSEYLGAIKFLPKIMIQFEVHGKDENDNPIVTSKNEPMTISKNFTLSLSENATLRKDLQSWRGRSFTQTELQGFELKDVLGVWATISVVKALGNNGKEYTNIANINSVPSAMKALLPAGFNPKAAFSIDDPDMDLFETFSENLKKKIQESPEWKARDSSPKEKQSSKGSIEDMDDDIPF